MLSNLELIRKFVQSSLQQQDVLLANTCMSCQSWGRSNQLMAKSEGIIINVILNNTPLNFSVKANSSHWEIINEVLAENGYILTGEADKRGFYLYQYCKVPQGYELHCTKSVILWRAWWKYRKYASIPGIPLELLIRYRDTWYPLRDLSISDGMLYVKVLGKDFLFNPDDLVIWISKLPKDTEVEK